MWRTLGLVALAAVLWSGQPVWAQTQSGTGDVKKLPLLRQAGTRLVDDAGHTVALRGVNLGGWLSWEGWIFGGGILTSETDILKRLDKIAGFKDTQRFRQDIYKQFVHEEDIRKIAELGFNVVRVPLNHRLFDDGPVRLVYKEQGFALLDELLGWCEKHRVYVIPDLHAAPGAQSLIPTADPGDALLRLWQSDDHKKKTIALWRAVAKRYKNRTVIAGYDLLNEPVAPSGEELVTFYERLIEAVRAEDPNHILFLEGGKLASDFNMFTAPPCKNVVYSFHMYTWGADDRILKVSLYQSLAKKHNVPLWVGEFGENRYEMIASTVELYKNHPEICGWAFWTWKRAPSKYPGLVTVKVPDEWKEVMAWVTNPLIPAQPDGEKTNRAMKAFIEQVRFPNAELDPKMVKALTGK